MNVGKVVLNACVDKMILRELGSNYLKKNYDLARDVVNFLDGMKEWIESKIGVNLSDFNSTPLVPVDGDMIDNTSIKKTKDTISSKNASHDVVLVFSTMSCFFVLFYLTPFCKK